MAATPHGSAVPASPSAAAPPVSPPSVAAAAVGRPLVDAVTCRTGCRGLATATAGSVVRLTGDGAESASSIVFLGRRGRGDDVVAAAHAVGPAAAEALLPAGAHGGPVRLVTLDGRRSARSARRIAVRPAVRLGRAFEAPCRDTQGRRRHGLGRGELSAASHGRSRSLDAQLIRCASCGS